MILDAVRIFFFEWTSLKQFKQKLLPLHSKQQHSAFSSHREHSVSITLFFTLSFKRFVNSSAFCVLLGQAELQRPHFSVVSKKEAT